MVDPQDRRYLTYNLRDRPSMSAGNKGNITVLTQPSLTEIPATTTSFTSNSVPLENDNRLLVPSTSTPALPTTPTTAATAIFVTSSTASTVSIDNPSIDAPEVVTSAHSSSQTSTTNSNSSSIVSALVNPNNMLRTENSVHLPKFSGKTGNISATQWWTLFVQWCALHSFNEQQILGRIVFHLTDIAQQWYLSLPESARTTLQQLKSSFLSRFGKHNSLRLDVYDIKQRKEESCEEYISRIQQMACDDDIPDLMLINLIAQGFKPEIAEKVIDRDPETFEDLFRFARRAESTIKFRKTDPVIASIESMEDRLMDRLSKQLETTVMTISAPQDSPRFRGHEHQQRHEDREPRDRYQGTNKQSKNFRPRYRDSNRDNYRDSNRDNYRDNNRDNRSYYRENNRDQHRPRNNDNRFPPSDTTPPQHRQHGNRGNSHPQYPQNGPSKCCSCFKETCDGINCIAIGKQCYYCYGYNHFKIACFSNPDSPFFKQLTNLQSFQ